MALYTTVPVCIQLTDYELEVPNMGVAPVYRTNVPPPPPPYNPSLYPSLYDVSPLPPSPSHNLPQYVALIGVNPMHKKTNTVVNNTQKVEQIKEDKEAKIVTKELILNKKEGKFGIKIAAVNKNIYIYRVIKGSPASLVGLKLGDQILTINGVTVTGMTNDNVHDVIKRCPLCGIKFTIRSRKDYGLFKKLDNMKKTLDDF